MGVPRCQTKRPAATATGLYRSAQLRELDAIRARALLARLDLKADALATGERVEVHARVESGSVEEILPPVLCGNEPKPAVGYKLLDSACRHLQLLFSKENLANARVLSRRIDDRGEHRPTSGRRNYLTTHPAAPNRAFRGRSGPLRRRSQRPPTASAERPGARRASIRPTPPRQRWRPRVQGRRPRAARSSARSERGGSRPT